MTDKRLKDTTDHEMILEYVDQLKQDNKRLKEELSGKRRPLFDFTSPVKLLRDIANNGTTQAFFWIFIIILSILVIYGLICISGPTGEYYVTRKGKYVQTIQPEKECSCPEPKRIERPCFRVMEEITLEQDKVIEGCFPSKEEAYKAAAEFTEEWERLHVRQKDE
jgi:hypothetical protein